MWVEETPNGKYKFVKRYTDPKTGKQKRISTTMNSKSSHARNQADKILSKRLAKKIDTVDTQDYTFEEMYNLWFQYKSKSWDTSSIQCNKSYYKNHVQPYEFNNYLLSKISLLDVQKVIDRVQNEKKLSRSYTIKIKVLITSVFNHALKFYNIGTPFDPKDIEITAKHKKTKSIEYIDSVDVPKVLKRMRDKLPEVYVDFIEAQILTGMRYQELAALTKDDWNIDKNTISINKAVKTSNKRKIGDTKNDVSVRVIQSSERLNEIFEKRIAINDVLFGEESSLIFANQNNRPQLLYYINRLLKEINPDYSTHTMRHTHVSLLAEQNLPLKYIMDRVGHSNPKTTLKIYNHVTSKMKEKGQNVLDNLY